VIGEDLGTVPDEIREALRPLGVLSYRLFYYERDYEGSGDFLPPEQYSVQALAAITTQDLPTLTGWWKGRDLEVRAELNLFPSEEVRERQWRARAEDRTLLLRALANQGLLAEGIGMDPARVPEMTPALSRAVHLYLARTPAKIMLVQLEDLVGQLDQVNVPGTTDEYPNWRRKLPVTLADLFADPEVRQTVTALTQERGPGAKPAPNSPDEGHGGTATIPRATYRLQFNAEFTFAQAAELVPYLADLGISHCYASPYLKARAGSTHGYDIVDHSAINPELGSPEDYDRFVASLQGQRMGQILDIVPNHMGVGGDDNGWWMEVLENGQSSLYAQFFDIDWRPIKEELRGRVLVPFLGERYGAVLEHGQLKLQFETETGAFAVYYYQHRLPIDPKTYPVVLSYHLYRLEALLGTADPDFIELQSLITAFEHLPLRTETSEDKMRERNRDKEVHKRRLAELYRRSEEVARFIDGNLIAFNGTLGDPGSFELLHGLLEQQAYRLASWRVASDEINYRRFFDVNALAGLRMERPEVFHAIHRLLLDLIASGKLNGLRIDHPDGLYDPVQYYERLQSSVAATATRVGQAAACTETAQGANAQAMPLYVVVEKILASYEHLPQDWPVHGTTGYEFANLVNGLLVYPESERYMDRIYARFIDQRLSFDDVVYERKRLIMKVGLNSELGVLANELDALSESDRHTRDFTLAGLRGALMEVVACFPVYRTYVTGQRVTAEDRRYVDWAMAQAKKRSTAADTSIFDFVHDILLLDAVEGKGPDERAAVTAFAMKFQQYTAPVMAKGMEDTAFYIYHRLVSLNEVGGDPRRYGVSLAAFHRANQERVRRWPHTMLSTSTHDNKRSEDVRARITVLSELPGEWRIRLLRWSRFNRNRKLDVDGVSVPSRNDEYLLYQTLVGTWPLGEINEERLSAFRSRIEAYMCKAVREAKVHTSWINPNAAYEEGLVQFIRGLLSSVDRSLFLQDFIPFQKQISRFGMFNGLSQTLLKLTVPGVPDIYQGNETWDFSLVDPDNRRPVDYGRRQAMLGELKDFVDVPAQALASRTRNLVDTMEDGRIKLYLTWKTLSLRQERPELFQRGSYLPLAMEGSRADHLCAFARSFRNTTITVVVPRWLARLLRDNNGGIDGVPWGPSIWGDTRVEAPMPAPATTYTNILTGEAVTSIDRDGRAFLQADALLANFPVALLLSD
jgi:(1->4)-alpha-D-glucan 1-alpha-D-glucosylmutase